MRGSVTFSAREIVELTLSTLVLGGAFAMSLSCSFFIPTPFSVCTTGPGFRAGPFFTMLFPSLAIVFFAFVLHELAHKVVAQRRGLWAEFRASKPGLAVALVVALLLGAVFASPGVVLIVGAATRRDAGVISIAGPLVNIALGLIAGVLTALTFDATGYPIRLAADGSAGVANVFELALFINAILAAFNMLPIRPLDGSKIIRWNVGAFIGGWLLVLGLFAFWLIGPPAVLGI